MNSQYADNFISRMIQDEPPISIMIGEVDLAAHLEAPQAENGGWIRRADVHGVCASVGYRLLGDALEVGVILENKEDQPSSMIHDIDFCNLFVPNAKTEGWGWGARRVHYSVGSPTTIYDFQPREEDLARPDKLVIDMTAGRSSEYYMPYFNFSTYDVQGVVAAIGWSGHWKADFRPEDAGTRIRFTYPASFYLNPGESVELPKVLLMPWEREDNGDRDLADVYVKFNRMQRKYILPKENGDYIRGQVCLRAWGGVDEDGHRNKLSNMKRFQMPCDAYGVDAGWYELNGNNECGGWRSTVGDWKEVPKVYPHGLEWLAESGRDAGAKGFWLWFEFERAVKESGAYIAHPEYYLGVENDEQLLNLGNPLAREYIKELLYPTIRKTDMTIFRVDFNFDPAPAFACGDTPDRQGITELHYYNGLYHFFRELLRDFPGIMIDNCASGGRRLDYRMSELSIPVMCRSDYFTIPNFEPEGEQAQTIGISKWLPLHGDSCGTCAGDAGLGMDTYKVRSFYGASLGLGLPGREMSEEEGKWYHDILTEASIVKEYMTYDFYPLTGYGYSRLDWCAFETCSEDQNRAMVMAFRRPLNMTPKQIYKLHGLKEDAVYQVKDLDSAATYTASGKALMAGFSIEIPQARDSRIFLIDVV